jgi:hypothetical protein
MDIYRSSFLISAKISPSEISLSLSKGSGKSLSNTAAGRAKPARINVSRVDNPMGIN